MNITIMLLGYMLCGSSEQRQYIINRVKAECIDDHLYSEIYRAASAIHCSGEDVNILSVYSSITQDVNSEHRTQKLRRIKEQLIATTQISKAATDDEVNNEIFLSLAGICQEHNYSISVQEVTQRFVEDYVARKKQEFLRQMQKCLRDSPKANVTDEINKRFMALDALKDINTWRGYTIDVNEEVKEPLEPALLSRDGVDLIYRGNIYQISAFKGSHKSRFCLSLAAAAYNGGEYIDRTLSFSASKPLKVLYTDTEQAKKSRMKRHPGLLKMVNGRIDNDRFIYLPLIEVPGDLEHKKQVLDEAIRGFQPDVIIIDSIRDICADINDYREADALIRRYRQVAIDYHAAVIITNHQSLLNANAKGHLGVRADEAADLGLSLAMDKMSNTVRVEDSKCRDELFKPFTMRYDYTKGYLEEVHATSENQIGNDSNKRQLQKSRTAIERALRANQEMKHNELVQEIRFPGGIQKATCSERTAKNYIHLQLGKLLEVNEAGLYRLAGQSGQISDDDIPPG